jgi:DNA sulfur modification protein DndD
MIIKEIRISNFLVFAGEQVMDLPTAKDSNLIVVLAANNTGKTNIIRALKFLFYGHLSDCTEATSYRLIHDGTRSDANVGTALSGWVQATLDLDGKALTIRRAVRSRKQGAEQWTPAELFFGTLEYKGREGIKLVLDEDGIYQTKIRTMVPEQLFDAFYFKGEPLDGKLLGGVGAIRESLASFLHEDRWEEAQSAVEKVRQYFHQQLGRLNEQNSEYTRLLNQEELLRNHLLKELERLKKLKAQQQELIGRFDDVTIRLNELGTGGDSEKWVAQLRELRGKLDSARSHHEKSDDLIARLVGSSRGLPFLLGAIPTARRILKQMQEDNILPADISEPFVNRILASKCCVCGHEHDDQTRAAWTRYKEKTLSVDLNRGLGDLLNAVEEKGSRSYALQGQETAARLIATRDTRSKALLEIESLQKSVGDLEKKLEASPLEEIRGLTQKMRTLASQREQIKADITKLEDDNKRVEANLKSQKDALHKARPSGVLAQKEKELRLARERADKLRVLIQESRETLLRSFHSVLQESVSEYYDRSSTDNSRARISKSTLLPAIEVNGQVHGNLGGGQSQLLALAYIVSLSRLRKSLHVQMQKLGIGYGRVDDQSFILDSPFNHVTDHYAHAIARFLEGNARQVVLLVARHQWNLVRPIIEPVADRIMAFKYHTLKDKISEMKNKDPKLEDFVYQVDGQKLNLIEELPLSLYNNACHPPARICPAAPALLPSFRGVTRQCVF